MGWPSARRRPGARRRPRRARGRGARRASPPPRRSRRPCPTTRVPRLCTHRRRRAPGADDPAAVERARASLETLAKRPTLREKPRSVSGGGCGRGRRLTLSVRQTLIRILRLRSWPRNRAIRYCYGARQEGGAEMSMLPGLGETPRVADSSAAARAASFITAYLLLSRTASAKPPEQCATFARSINLSATSPGIESK